MNCPRCHAVLSVEKYEGIQIDRCSSCKGMWLDYNELDQLEDKELNDDETGVTAIQAMPPQIPARRKDVRGKSSCLNPLGARSTSTHAKRRLDPESRLPPIRSFDPGCRGLSRINVTQCIFTPSR